MCVCVWREKKKLMSINLIYKFINCIFFFKLSEKFEKLKSQNLWLKAKIFERRYFWIDDVKTMGIEYTNNCLLKIKGQEIEQVLEAPPHKAAAVRPLNAHHENYQS